MTFPLYLISTSLPDEKIFKMKVKRKVINKETNQANCHHPTKVYYRFNPTKYK